MRIHDILTESSYHKLPAIKTVFEADWDNEPIKHYTDDEQREIHRSEELPYTSMDSSINKYTNKKNLHHNIYIYKYISFYTYIPLYAVLAGLHFTCIE